METVEAVVDDEASVDDDDGVKEMSFDKLKGDSAATKKAFRALSQSKSSSNFITHLCHKINSKLKVQVLMFPLQILLMQFVASTWGNLCYKEAVF
ncbi:hypothetical protein NC652_041683 [Populus alba x Populus x berolinensis]|nr:hypothetical protein NC652_041683 [Populus alba x Populus x berolinensis]